MTTLLIAFVGVFARLYPWEVDVSEELRDALVFLGWDVSPEVVVRAGYGAGIVAGLASGCLIPFVAPALRFEVILASALVVLAVAHGSHSLPRLAVKIKQTSALGAAPDLVARAVLSMRLSPTPERAAEFAAQTSDGVLASSLGSHIRQTQNSARSGLTTFGDAWGERFPSLRRSFALLMVAGRTPEDDRYRLLDRALSVVLEGTREQLRTFATKIRGPVTALYAFGVLLPTALVALLPAAGFVDVAVSPLVVVLCYNIFLPALLVAVSVWLLANRPVAFPPPDVTRDHPGVTDRHRTAVGCGIVVGVVSWLAGTRLFPVWGPPVAAVGLGVGTVLVVANYPVVSVYGNIRDIEDGLSDALELIGRRVANGWAVESAIEQVGDELEGPMGTLVADGARQQRQLHVGVHEAFLGQYGVLQSVPSPRVRGSFALLSLAAKEGRPAGSALLSLAEHVEELQRIERDARQQLTRVCQTLVNTAAIFGPMVAGATVALSDSITGGETFAGNTQSLTWLGGPVGFYVLSLSVILTVLSVGLIRGFDRSLLGFRVGRAMIAGTLIYLCSYLAVGGVI
jgi:hypothetical protein